MKSLTKQLFKFNSKDQRIRTHVEFSELTRDITGIKIQFLRNPMKLKVKITQFPWERRGMEENVGILRGRELTFD